MYEERKDKFSIRDLVIQILFIALFVFLLMWLFPTKGDLSKLNFGSNNSGKVDTNTVLYDRIFNENIISMKDSAKSYYTTPRLPQNVGEKVSMTLSEMLDKKIILPFVDKNGKSCDTEKSYVEITKADDEYVLKVNLKCSKEENYLLVYMGCYDYCSTTICEKNKEDVAAPVVYKSKSEKPTNNITNIVNNVTNNIINVVCPECCPTPTPDPGKPTPTPDPGKPTPTPDPGKPTPTPDPGKPTPTPVPGKNYECEYLKVTNATFKEWGAWSNWTDQQQYATQLKQVKSKKEKTTITQKVLTGYNVVTYKDSNKPIYKQVQVKSGEKTEKKCTSYGTQWVNDGTVKYGAWQDQGLVKLYTIPTGSATVSYVYNSRGVDSCEGCSYAEYFIYRKYTRTTTQGQKEQTVCTGYTTVKTPLYSTVNVLTGYGTSERKDPVYKDVKKTVEKRYYSYRIRGINSGSKDLKWDICEGSSLVNKGYNPTGNKREK